MGLVLFWEALCFEVAVGVLERAKDGEVVGVLVWPLGLVLLLVGLQLD